jgi:DNA-binding transcriptional LysR family regulator
MNPKMTLRQLRYFEIVAEERSLTRAAARIGVAQPALGRHMQSIERTLGVPIFGRTTRGLELTTRGAGFLREVKDLLAHYARLESEFVSRDGPSEMVRIGFDSSAAQSKNLSSAVAIFKARRPHARLELLEMCEQRQLDSLARGELDAALAYDICDEFSAIPALNVLQIQTDRLMILTAQDHPLAQCREVTATQVDGLPFVFVSREKCPKAGYDFLMSRLRSLGVGFELVQEVDNVSALISLVAAGVGISLGAENMREDLAQRVSLLTLRGLELEFKLVLIWNKRNANPALASFLDAMRPGKTRLMENRPDTRPTIVRSF